MRIAYVSLVLIAASSASSAECRAPGPKTFAIGPADLAKRMGAAGVPVKLGKGCASAKAEYCELTFAGDKPGSLGVTKGCVDGLVTTAQAPSVQGAREQAFNIAAAFAKAVDASPGDLLAIERLRLEDTSPANQSPNEFNALTDVACCLVSTKAHQGSEISSSVLHFFPRKRQP